MKGFWIICIKSYDVDGIEINKGRMKCTEARLPVNGFWRLATKDEIATKKWHKGTYFNLKNV